MCLRWEGAKGGELLLYMAVTVRSVSLIVIPWWGEGVYKMIRSAGEELVEGEHHIIVFLFSSLACECFENSINVGGQSGRLQIQVRKLVKETSVISCCLWLVKAVCRQSCICPNA